MQTQIKEALAYALHLLSKSSKTSSSLAKALASKKIAPKVIEEVVSFCCQKGYIDDEHLATRLVEKLLVQGKGPLYIAAKLKSLGLNPALAYKITEEEESQALQAFLAKKRLSPRQMQQRGFRHAVLCRYQDYARD